MRARASSAAATAGKWILKTILLIALRFVITIALIFGLIYAAQYCYRQATEAQTRNNGLPYLQYESAFSMETWYNGNNCLLFNASARLYRHTATNTSEDPVSYTHLTLPTNREV